MSQLYIIHTCTPVLFIFHDQPYSLNRFYYYFFYPVQVIILLFLWIFLI